MKKFNMISLIVLGLTLLIFIICSLLDLPDIVIEINGIIMLTSIFTTSFTTVKVLKDKNE